MTARASYVTKPPEHLTPTPPTPPTPDTDQDADKPAPQVESRRQRKR